ncbi:GNAT family N-acetyltransferase [Saccharibacillus sp. O23]|nr:GNAT family N-acetyltransferase [Saccharibacillus sp. O23]
MIREIGPGENGFVNGLYAESEEAYRQKLADNVRIASGENLPEGYVRQQVYWLYDGDRPVGCGKLRYWLTDALRLHGGHIGYTIRPSERGHGYGTAMLRELSEEAAAAGIDEVMLTCNADNTASRRVIERCGGRLEKLEEGSCTYWIKTGEQRPRHT